MSHTFHMQISPRKDEMEVDSGHKYELNNRPLIETIRLKVKKFFATSLFGHIYSNILLILSVLSSIQYLYQTYLHSDNPEEAVLL